jgi:hypothetical protein
MQGLRIAQDASWLIADPSFSKLTTALRTATPSPNKLDYDKEKASFSDILHAFLQSSLVLEIVVGM